MEVFAIVFVVAIAGVVGYLVAISSEPEQPPIDPEAELKAAVELHRIRRNLDASWTKTQQRQDAEQLRRQIRDELDEG